MNLNWYRRRITREKKLKFLTQHDPYKNGMKFERILISFYKESNPKKYCFAWANYNEDGCLINITSYYGEVFEILNNGKIHINNEAWISKDQLNINLY